MPVEQYIGLLVVFALTLVSVSTRAEDALEVPVSHERPSSAWAPASAYLLPEEHIGLRLEIGTVLPDPRDNIHARVRFGGDGFGLELDHVLVKPFFISDERQGCVAQTLVRAGAHFSWGSLGGGAFAYHVWDRPPGNLDGTSIGLGPYVRLGSTRGLHLDVGAYWGWSPQDSYFTHLYSIAAQVPILRHRVVELDLVARTSIGSLFIHWLVDVRALLAGHVRVGIGWRTGGLGLTLGYES